jgi:hypothetical protein
MVLHVLERGYGEVEGVAAVARWFYPKFSESNTRTRSRTGRGTRPWTESGQGEGKGQVSSLGRGREAPLVYI